MRVVLVGPPGAGKGTQAKRLADQFGLKHLSSGDILRAEKASGSDLGKTLAQYMDAGQLVPDDVVVGVMAKAVGQYAEQGLLLDGFPRTVPQAKSLDEQLDKQGTPLDVVAVIEVPDDKIVNRICGRRSCPECGAIYHVEFLKPAKPGECDKCGYKGEFEQRGDDTEQVVRQRLSTYHAQTAPVIEYYKQVSPGKIETFDGDQAPDAVTAEMVQRLQAKQA